MLPRTSWLRGRLGDKSILKGQQLSHQQCANPITGYEHGDTFALDIIDIQSLHMDIALSMADRFGL